MTSQEARDWYRSANSNNDRPLAERISVLGSALQHYYNQEQGSDGQLKPPGHYSHPAVTISQEERQQMEGGAHALSVGEAREWYGIAKLKGDQPLIDRIEALGGALKQHHNQEQGGERQLKPPANYSHPAVTISREERQQMESDRAAWREAMIPKPQVPRREAIVL